MLQVLLEKKTGEIAFKPDLIGEKEICEVIEDMGFEASLQSELPPSCVINVQGMSSSLAANELQGKTCHATA